MFDDFINDDYLDGAFYDAASECYYAVPASYRSWTEGDEIFSPPGTCDEDPLPNGFILIGYNEADSRLNLELLVKSGTIRIKK